MNFTLKIWRQKNRKDKGNLVDYKISNISKDSSFLEMLDVLNEELIEKHTAWKAQLKPTAFTTLGNHKWWLKETVEE